MTYQYTAKDKTAQTVAGTLDANSETEVVEALHGKGLIVISISQAKKKTVALKTKRIKLDDLVVFSNQLATMIDAGIPLVQSLGIVGEQIEDNNFKKVVLTIRQDIEAGMSFCDALGRHPVVFSELFINMVRAGEASGMLNEVLERLAVYLEKTAMLIRKVRSSLVYPVVVVVMSFLITAFLLLKVVPTFKGIFAILGGQLPLPTLILIMISDTLRTNFIFVVIIMVGLFFAFRKYINTENGRYKFDAWKLKIPILGVLFAKVALAKFSRTFSTLVKSGVTILNALDIVAKTAGNKIIEETVNDCRVAVRKGESIAEPLSKSGVFPPMVCRMIAIGEHTGQLEKMLSKIADFYDEQVDASVAALTSIIEPVVIAFLGIVIGGIAISLFLPVFKISELVTR